MIFYKNTLYFISFIFLPTALLLKELRITKSGSAPASVCKIGLEFFAELNNTSGEDFHVELLPDECCLKGAEGDDCDSLQIIGECSEVIPKGTDIFIISLETTPRPLNISRKNDSEIISSTDFPRSLRRDVGDNDLSCRRKCYRDYLILCACLSTF